jgi:hypothetical protein
VWSVAASQDYRLGLGDTLGEAVGLAPGEGEALAEGEAEAVAVVAGPEDAAEVPWWPKINASGTMISPTSTVRTKLTAPHSRRRKERFTERRF